MATSLIFESGGSEFASDSLAWAKQWQAKPPLAHGDRRFTVPLTLHAPHEEYTRVLTEACDAAGHTGTVLFLVGHGAAGATGIFSTPEEKRVGTLDLAPCQVRIGGRTCDLRIQQGIVFYNQRPHSGIVKDLSQFEQDIAQLTGSPLARERFRTWVKYISVGTIAQMYHIRRIVLLTCSVARATTFMRKVAQDWQVEVQAYTRRTLATFRRKNEQSEADRALRPKSGIDKVLLSEAFS